jgi:hypothetical protein
MVSFKEFLHEANFTDIDQYAEDALHALRGTYDKFWADRIAEMLRHATWTHSNTKQTSKIRNLKIPKDWPVKGKITFVRSEDGKKMSLTGGKGKDFKINESKEKDDKNVSTVRFLYKQGKNSKQISKATNIPLDTVKKIMGESLEESTKWKIGDGRPRNGAHIENIRFWDLSKAELEYIIKDADKAIKANPTGKKASSGPNNYADQINDAHTVLAWRKKEGIK